MCGARFTEADLRLFPTVVRFDAVYATLFKCSRRRVADYPHLQAWMRDVHQLRVPGARLQIAVRAPRGGQGGRGSLHALLLPFALPRAPPPTRHPALLPAPSSSHPAPSPHQDCFDLDDARRSYFGQLFPLNPGGIVPSGPTAADLGLERPAGRGPAAVEEVFHLKPAAQPGGA